MPDLRELPAKKRVAVVDRIYDAYKTSRRRKEDLAAACYLASIRRLMAIVDEVASSMLVARLPELGKLDRQALSALGGTAAPEPVRIVPATETERTLAGIWREVLKRDDVGTTDNFFQLGGHSLMAIRVLGRVSGVLAVVLDLSGETFLASTREAAVSTFWTDPGS